MHGITEVPTNTFVEPRATCWPSLILTANCLSVIIVFVAQFRGLKVTTMCRPFKFLLFILAIQRHDSVDCHAPGSLIWSRSLQKFIPISNVSTFGAYEQEIVTKNREPEKHNFEGEIVKLGSAQDYNMVNFIEHDTKVTGVCGEIWNTLAEYSNFTLVTIKVNEFAKRYGRWNLTAIGMIERKKIQIVPRIAFTSLYSDIMDFTMPIWETKYRIYIKPEWKSDTNWMFNIFEKKVWFAILLCFLLLSGLGYLMQNISIKVSGDEKQRHNLHDHLFYTFATLCSQGFIPETLDRRSQIFGVSKKIFAWLLLIVLSSHVISRMTNIKLQPPFEDIESMLKNTNYTINIYDSSPGIDQYKMMGNNLSINMGIDGYPLWGRRIFLSHTQEVLYNAICDSEERALFELEDTKQAFGSRFCKTVAVGKSYFPTWITFGISKRFKYKRTFDIGILKMKEFGLIDRLKNRWLKNPAQTVDSENLGHKQFKPVTLDQVLMLFIILGIGIAASAIILILEIIVSVYKSNQRRPVKGKILIDMARLNAHRPTDRYLLNRMRLENELSRVRRMPIYVQNVFLVDSNCCPAQDNDCPHSTLR